jgi:chemotaxis protein MotA
VKIFGLFIVGGGVVLSLYLQNININTLVDFQEMTILVTSLMGILLMINNSSMKDWWQACSLWVHSSKINKKILKDHIKFLGMITLAWRDGKRDSEIEQALDAPKNHHLFASDRLFQQHQVGRTFFCDHWRLLLLGGINSEESFASIIDEDIQALQKKYANLIKTLQILGDTSPALGIMMAILGIVRAMSAIEDSPHQVGIYVAKALYGTFIGIFFAYSIFFPFSNLIQKDQYHEKNYLLFLKKILLGFFQMRMGKKILQPLQLLESARTTLTQDLRPDFLELEKIITQGENAFISPSVSR